MAIIQYYNVVSCRGIISRLAGLGLVLPTQPVPQAGGTSPFSYTIGADTYQFYSGPSGGPHPGWASGLGVEGDYLAWSGLRCATHFWPQIWTSFTVDPDYDNDSASTYATSATRVHIHTLHARSSVDGSTYNYKTVFVVAHYAPAVGSWNYIVQAGGGDASGNISIAGLGLSQSSIQALAEALAAMIQIVNNVTVGTELLEPLSSIQTSLELLNTALGADGFADSFDAAMDLLIDKFGETGPFATLQADLQAIRDSLGANGPLGESSSQLALLVAALGAGGLLGALGSGGALADKLDRLNPLLSAVQSIGTVADVLVEYQQLGKLDGIVAALNSIQGHVSLLSNTVSTSADQIAGRIAAPAGADLGYVLTNSLPGIHTAAANIVSRLGQIEGRFFASIGGVEYDLVEAIATFAGGGGSGAAVDLSPLVAKLEEIRQAMGTGTVTFDMDRLKEILDGYFLTEQNGEQFNLAYLIISLLNTGWIVYK